MGLIQSVDTSDLREHLSTDETVECPMCGKRHRVGLVGESGMNEDCLARLMRQREQMRDQVRWLEHHGQAG
jgi:hypothetical protein